MTISRLVLVFFYYIIVLVNISEQQQLPNSTTISTCNFTACNSQRTPCSSNRNCECFSLTRSPSVGICASAVLSCTDVVRCNTDNRTCPIENTVCVNSTRCGQPVCYPLALANKLVCPSNTTATTTTTVRTTTTTRAGGLTNTTRSTTRGIDSFAGVQLNLATSLLSSAWSPCYTATYATNMSAANLPGILALCNGTRLLLGCRPVGSAVLTVAAMGDRSAVLHDCGSAQNCAYVTNGVGWYYSDSWSWGFVNGNDTVSRTSCDTVSIDADYRLCWHTAGGGGYRCGATLYLNDDTTWEKEILQRLVVADVDGDDKLDIIVTYIGFNNIAISFNDGDGIFSKSTTYTTDCSPNFVAIGDIINDNALDIVVANIL
ncbi:unnamed protein product [Adineta steineri]|uniref:Uncharacterized protein n=1 Tax=Adineta steineri TaxID=433720 RepID=A0A814DJZ5_9BILA|nr:unnamed protein product [Adineta steineri]CAF1331431.1 unnamed protein product [Adineta steineri]